MKSLIDSMKDAFQRLNDTVANSVANSEANSEAQDKGRWRADGRVPFGLWIPNRMVVMGAGSLTFIAGRPGVGKTSLALHVARTAAHAQHPVLIICPAAKDEEIATRLTCAEARVDLDRLHLGYLTPSDWNSMTEAAIRLRELAVSIDDVPFVTAESLGRTVDRFCEVAGRERCPLVVVDYVQMIRANPRRQNRYEELCDVSFELKCIARRTDVAVLTVSMMNRSIDDRGPDAIPHLSDLRDSGTLEDDADAVLLLHRPLRGQDEDHSCRSIIIAKNRHGRLGTVRARVGLDGSWDEPRESEDPA